MIDAHCHLQEFENPSGAIAGLEAVICCGSGVKSSQKAVDLASKYKEVFATVGVHPEDIDDRDEAKLRRLLKMPKIVAVGECGLDTGSDEEVELFKFNIKLARETGLPLVVHCRNQFEKVFEVLDYDKVQMHCFTGNLEQMQECVKRGWYISFGGMVTFKSSHNLREVVKSVPEERLLIETDAPFLAPEPVRGTQNEPKNVKIVAAKIAEVRSTSINQIDEVTTRNARLLFGLTA